MKKLLISLAISLPLLTACAPSYTPSDAEIAERRARVRALDNEDYQIQRQRRQDAIQDLGTIQMNEAEAINKSYENRSRQTINIFR
ncbi:hypothetical protein ACERCG_00850 [Mannheimia sp. E30BD]|uniref:hypothetical protein n=1 Tax=Mannheimia sp. E30BD TaxID=3278708 RepID=UPI00359D24D4